MPNSELFFEYAGICFDRLLKSLDDFVSRQSGEHLFRFRVEIKKIRTCLDCIEQKTGKKDFKKTRAELKKIFSLAGTLRELELYEQWFRKHRLHKLAASIGLEAEIAQMKDHFLRVRNKTTQTIREARSWIMPHARDVTENAVAIFYVKLLKERLEQLMKKLKEDQWHKTRKDIKKLRYARKWQTGIARSLLNERQNAYLDRLQRLIGVWHDNEVRMEWLKERKKNFLEKIPGAVEPAIATAFARGFHIMTRSRRILKRKVTELAATSARQLRPVAKKLQVQDTKVFGQSH